MVVGKNHVLLEIFHDSFKPLRLSIRISLVLRVVARHVEQPLSVARYQNLNNSSEGRQTPFRSMLSFPTSRTGSRGKCHGTQPLRAPDLEILLAASQ